VPVRARRTNLCTIDSPPRSNYSGNTTDRSNQGRVQFMLDSAPEAPQATTLYHDDLIAMRLALVASLVETLMPASPANADKPATPGLPKRQLRRVAAYIDANIGEPITLAKLAATAGLSRMYFARQFRAATGIRPHEYVLRKRVGRAQQLLTATSDALVDIALSVGFQTQAHFTTVFKKIVGNTPRQWRREQADAA
jgi:AraC-like DNA-binding protein